MTISQLLILFRSRARLIAAVFFAFLLSGMALFFPRQKLYEVSMLVESTKGTESVYQPFTIGGALDRGMLDEKLAARAGVDDIKLLPKLEAGGVGLTNMEKIYAFVPAAQIENTKAVLNAVFEIAKEEAHGEYSKEIDILNEKVERLQKAKKHTDKRLKTARSPAELERASKDLDSAIHGLSDILRSVGWMKVKPQILSSSVIKMVRPPGASDSEAGPTNVQVLIAFGLLGFVAGLSAALWSAERDAGARPPVR